MRRAYVVIAVVLAISFSVPILIAFVVPEDTRTSILQAVAEAAIGLFPVAVFGVIINELIRQRDEEQASAAKIKEARREFRDRAIVAYNESKMVRRVLRGAGFASSMTDEPTAAMLGTLDEQMHALSHAQLKFDQLKRESTASTAAFGRAEVIRELLERIEQDLNKVVSDWEHGRARIGEHPVQTWQHLAAFVADKDAEGQAGLREAFQQLEREVLAELVADPRPAVRGRTVPAPS